MNMRIFIHVHMYTSRYMYVYMYVSYIYMYEYENIYARTYMYIAHPREVIKEQVCGYQK